MNLEKWKHFFSDAGIPANDAATYAFKFAHNRIQTDMLVDLNKDYLKDMGITIMGDVITILRHAKQVYEEIQKTGKIEILEEFKDKKKEKDVIIKVPKKLPEPTATKTDVSKPSSKPVKRKSNSSVTNAKKPAVDPPKKSKVDVNEDNIEECEELGYVMIDSSKKSILFDQKLPKNVENQFKGLRIGKPDKIHTLDSNLFRMSEDEDDNVEVIINDPIVTPFGGYKKFPTQDSNLSRSKESSRASNGQDSKRTVFKRLGEEISQHSVTSTTPFEDDDQLSLANKKLREDAAKSIQEKNSVFQRLGQKCDVTSTSVEPVDKYPTEERKQKKSDRDSTLKAPTVFSTKNTIGRKVKIQSGGDLNSNVPAYVRATYSEGILASNSNARKLSLKERVGQPKTLSNFKSRAETGFRTELPIRKSTDSYFSREKILFTKKRVSFGSVSQKLIPSREEAIRTGELPDAIEERTSVFDRLGFNRTY